MANEWTEKELKAATIAYMWMRRSVDAGYKPDTGKVFTALRSGVLSTHSLASLKMQFKDTSAVLQGMKLRWIPRFQPSESLTPVSKVNIRKEINAYLKAPRRSHRVSELVRSLNPETILKAASDLAAGVDFKYAESRKFDVVLPDGTRLAPKEVIGYAGKLQYGAPLLSADFTGGEDSPAFRQLNKAGLVVLLKYEDATEEGEQFRKQVSKVKKKGLRTKPKGNPNPKKKNSVSSSYERLAEVVAYVEERANGICELCAKPAPFKRANKEPFLEVHHIIPLSEDGPDIVENAAALCPNCHRKCHHWKDAISIREPLLEKIMRK